MLISLTPQEQETSQSGQKHKTMNQDAIYIYLDYFHVDSFNLILYGSETQKKTARSTQGINIKKFKCNMYLYMPTYTYTHK